MNIAVIPGFLGSDLFDSTSPLLIYSDLVWVNKQRILSGALKYLDLDAAGVGPGTLADGMVCRNGGPQVQYYGSLISSLQDAGHNVVGMGWDWRKSLEDAGLRLYLRCRVEFGDDPVALVCHSAGGLVGRLVASRYVAAGHLDLIKRIIYLGSPQWGTTYVAASVCRQDAVYRSLAGGSGGTTGTDPVAPDPTLDTLLTDFVALWQLLPTYGYGPFWDSDPTQVSHLYDSSNWSRVNAGVRQSRLDAAKAFWGTMELLTFRSREVFFYGSGQLTPANVQIDASTGKIRLCSYADVGDGTVAQASALPADAQASAGSPLWTHQGMPARRDVQQLIVQHIGPP